jgi:hypothetical protein
MTERYGLRWITPRELIGITTTQPHPVTSTAVKVLKTVVLWAVLLGGLMALTLIADRLIGAPSVVQPVMFLFGMYVGSVGYVMTQAVWSEW